MASYTSLEQSKKLAEFLPPKSADMRFCFSHALGGRITGHYPMLGREPSLGTVPCWSCAALLKVIRETVGYELLCNKTSITIKCELGDNPWSIEINKDNELDACVETIIKLHEQNLL